MGPFLLSKGPSNWYYPQKVAMDEQAFVWSFIKKHSLAVLATTDGQGNPEAAVLAFAETEPFELIFNTSNTTRKYQNLRTNPRVAVVIGWDYGQTVQYEGQARELKGEEATKYKEIFYAKHPDSRRYEQKPDERHFAITPRWLRNSDINQEPPTMIELMF